MLALKSTNLSLTLAPEIGGSICSFDYVCDSINQSLLRPTLQHDSHLITDFSSWPLVPFSNRIKHGKFSFLGNDYRIPINYLGFPHASHGQGWERPWDVAEHTGQYCHLTFRFSDLATWPFPYFAEQKFELHADSLDLELTITNIGNQKMPAGLGIHPYFPKPPGTRFFAETKNLWEIDETVIPTRQVPTPTEYDFSSGAILDDVILDHCFNGYKGNMKIVWPDLPASLRLTSSNNLDHLVVYTPKNKDFFCAEPVSHRPDILNSTQEDEVGMAILCPGESMSAHYNFSTSRNING